MDAHEGAFIVAFERRAGGAVGFVANNQVKVGQPQLLRLVNDLDGVIGAEHDGHVLIVLPRRHAQLKALGIGGGRVTQLVREGLDGIVFLSALLLAHIAVGTHCKAVQRDGAFLRPLGQGLRQQRQTGYQKQNALALACDALGDLQAGKCLASAAGHDQLAAICCLKSGAHCSQRGVLVRTQRLPGLQDHGGLGLIPRPVDLAGFQVVQGDLADRRLLVDQRVLGVLAPVVGAAYDDAMSERLATGRSEKAVDVLLLKPVFRIVELALNGMDDPGACFFGHQVDTVILGAKTVVRRPFGPGPDPTVQVSVGSLVAEIGKNQLLEIGALLTLGHGRTAQRCKHGAQGRFGRRLVRCERSRSR